MAPITVDLLVESPTVQQESKKVSSIREGNQLYGTRTSQSSLFGTIHGLFCVGSYGIDKHKIMHQP
jgi:hypothetical protein